MTGKKEIKKKPKKFSKEMQNKLRKIQNTCALTPLTVKNKAVNPKIALI